MVPPNSHPTALHRRRLTNRDPLACYIHDIIAETQQQGMQGNFWYFLSLITKLRTNGMTFKYIFLCAGENRFFPLWMQLYFQLLEAKVSNNAEEVKAVSGEHSILCRSLVTLGFSVNPWNLTALYLFLILAITASWIAPSPRLEPVYGVRRQIFTG